MGRLITYFGLFIVFAPWVWALSEAYYARWTHATGETLMAAGSTGTMIGMLTLIPGLIIATVGVVLSVLAMICGARRKRV